MSSTLVSSLIEKMGNQCLQGPAPTPLPVRTATTPALTARALDVHFYDGQMDPRAVAKVNGTPQTSFDEVCKQVEEAIAKDGVDLPAELRHMQPALHAYRTLAPQDPTNGVNVQDAFCVAWSMVQKADDRDLRQLFYLNLDDMIRTNGTCQQGRSSRMLQIVAALLDV